MKLCPSSPPSSERGGEPVGVRITVERLMALYAQQTPTSIRQMYSVCQRTQESRRSLDKHRFCTGAAGSMMLSPHPPRAGHGCYQRQAAALTGNKRTVEILTEAKGNESLSGKCRYRGDVVQRQLPSLLYVHFTLVPAHKQKQSQTQITSSPG